MNATDVQKWLQERLPADLCRVAPDVADYEDEILVMLTAAPAGESESESDTVARLREQSRPLRMRLARELQRLAGRPVAWGIRIGSTEALFTTRSAPVMTRLGRSERDVLDTLVASGLAETRSAALAFVVRAFAKEHAVWLAEAREAIAEVEKVRARLTITSRSGTPQAE